VSGSKSERRPDGYLEPGSYYGDVVARRDCGGVLLSELRHDSARRLPSHSHESAFFSLLLDGSYRERFGNRQFDYKRSTVLFHRPDFSHRDEIGAGGGHFFMVEVPPQLLRRLQECSAVPDVVVGGRGSEISLLAIRLYHEYAAPGVASELTVEGLMMEMLGQVARDGSATEKQRPHWLDRAVEMLHTEFDRNLTVAEIANAVGVHPFHLSRVFRRFYRQSIGEYTYRLRVEFACRELSKREPRLADIAFRGGFADQSHFCRVFKRVTGVTPGAFRSSISTRDDGTQ
jgi:AraC family transcriptional regulator